MIGTIGRVIRGEGVASALRRSSERLDEAARDAAMLARGVFARNESVPILNVSATRVVPRNGGVQVQLLARLEEERKLRSVALLQPGRLQIGSHARAIRGDFETSLRAALAITGARLIHLEGTDGAPMEALVRAGVPFIVSVHDDTLLHAPESLRAATRVIFPSAFLAAQYNIAGEIIEPGIRPKLVHVADERRAIAFAPGIKRRKGAHLLPEIVRGAECHVFGGGDEELFRALRRAKNFHLHGYYRAGELPLLLARHRVGLLLLPSPVPESFSLTMSEAWLAGAGVATFDLGAQAERIRREGGGWIADDLAAIVDRWIGGELSAPPPRAVPFAADAARAYIAIYRRLELLD